MSKGDDNDEAIDMTAVSNETRIPDGESLLEALERLGFFFPLSTLRTLGAFALCCTVVGGLYVWNKTRIIPAGSIGLTMRNGRPLVLGPGRYVLTNALHSFVGISSIDNPHISLGSLTIVTINKGQLGLSWKNGELIILEPGRHILVAPHTFKEAKDISENFVQLGPVKRMIVNEGQVGIAYDTGKLEVLPPGLHIRNSPTFRFQEFVSVQEQVTRMEPLRVNTNDGIRIMVNAILTFRVDDPVRAYRDVNNVVKALFDKAEAALTSIFLHHSIDEIAPTIPMGKEQEDFDDTQDGEDIGKKKGKGKAKERERSNTSLFSDIVRQAFMDDLKDYVATWGVALIDMSIEKLEFGDQALRDLLTNRASNKLETASNRANIAAQAQTGIQKAQGLAQEARIKADAELYTAEQRAKGARLQADTDLAKQLAVMRAMREIVEAAGNKTTFIPWNMSVDLREGASTDEHGFFLSDAAKARQRV